MQWVEINIKGAYSSAPDSFIKINVLVHYIYLIKYNSSFKMKENNFVKTSEFVFSYCAVEPSIATMGLRLPLEVRCVGRALRPEISDSS